MEVKMSVDSYRFGILYDTYYTTIHYVAYFEIV